MQALYHGCFTQVAYQARGFTTIAKFRIKRLTQFEILRNFQALVLPNSDASRQQTAHALQRRVFTGHKENVRYLCIAASSISRGKPGIASNCLISLAK